MGPRWERLCDGSTGDYLSAYGTSQEKDAHGKDNMLDSGFLQQSCKKFVRWSQLGYLCPYCTHSGGRKRSHPAVDTTHNACHSCLHGVPDVLQGRAADKHLEAGRRQSKPTAHHRTVTMKTHWSVSVQQLALSFTNFLRLPCILIKAQ